MAGSKTPAWPLTSPPKAWTAGGSFGAKRPSSSNYTRRHQGVDLYAPEGAPVLATEDGIISGDQGWSGSGTRGLWVDSPSTGVSILYGAVAPGSYGPKGTQVKRGQQIATVGKYPGGSTMLHFELWTKTQIPRPRWEPNASPPASLLDPAPYLQRAMGQSQSPSKTKTSSSSSGGLILAGAVVVVGLLLLK